ncbi:MAG: LCP family protein, partial [Gaiellaceae bacterium]
MPSNGKPYRVYRGGRLRRPRRRIRSADDVRLTVPPAYVDELDEGESEEPLTDEHLDVDDRQEHGDFDLQSRVGDGVEADELSDPELNPGYAIVEPPPTELPPRPGALPPSPQTSPGRPHRRLRRTRRRAEPEPRPRRRGLGFAWFLTKWALGLATLAAFACVAWGIIGFFVIRGGVTDANQRVDAATRAALTEPPGSALTTPRTILFLGVDTGGAREGTGRADSIVLMRTDPDQHRISLLAIPRDLRVAVQGRGLDKINAAYAAGGAAATIEAIDELTGIPVHHVALIDFDSFPDVIDAVGGVTLDVPKPIVSNRFDCPYPSQVACEQWEGWRFSPGRQTMSGERALVYSRVRENRLDESESDITRGSRQQAVIRATADQ